MPPTNPEGTASSLTRSLACFVSSLRFDDLPVDVRTLACQGVLDWLGCALAGTADPAACIACENALQEGGRAEATILCHNTRLSVSQAAFVNGVAGHALDFDDKHFAVPGHPSSPVLPVVFALGELLKRSGPDLIVAYVAGLEVACRVGLFLGPAHYDTGWHATGTVGTFGAAAAAARLLALSDDETSAAFGLAATQAAGLKSTFGYMAKSFNVGKAGMNGLLAARLAQRGFTAPLDGLECEQGTGQVQSGNTDPQAAFDGLGSRFWIRELLFKYHASCYATHAIIEAARTLAGPRRFDPGEISSIRIAVPRIALGMCNIPSPTNGTEAKFSLRHTAAMALSGRDTSNAKSYNAAICRDRTISALRGLMEVVADDDLLPGTGHVSATFHSGETVSGYSDMRVPERDLPRQAERLAAKFRALAVDVVSEAAADTLIGLVTHLTELDSPAPILDAIDSRLTASHAGNGRPDAHEMPPPSDMSTQVLYTGHRS